MQEASYMKMHVYCVFDYFSSILSSLQQVSYIKVHVYCVFDYFLFNTVSTLGGELRKSAYLLCVWLFFFSIWSPLQAVSYVKVHVYCAFDYFLFNLVSNSGGELRESTCLLCLTIFFSILSSLQEVSYVKVHVHCGFDYFLFNLVSTSAGELCKSACLLCVRLFSLQSCLHFSRWATWKYMFIVCLTIFSSILTPLQPVSYVKEHVYCVFDYFLFNFVSTSAGELRESTCLMCVSLFSLQSCLHFSQWVTWKSMFIVYLTIFSSILSPLQTVSYMKVHVYCVFYLFLFNLVSTSVSELV